MTLIKLMSLFLNVCYRWSVMTYEVPTKQTPAILKEEDPLDSPLQVTFIS